MTVVPLNTPINKLSCAELTRRLEETLAALFAIWEVGSKTRHATWAMACSAQLKYKPNQTRAKQRANAEGFLLWAEKELEGRQTQPAKSA